MWKLILVAIAFCVMVPTAGLAQSPLAAMAKAKGDSAWCIVLPQACQLGDAIRKLAAKFRRGAKHCGDEPAPAIPEEYRVVIPAD